MSVATRNPFALLNDDDEEVAAPVTTPTPAPAPEAAQTPASRPNNKTRGQVNNGPRSGRYPRRGGAPAVQDSEPVAANPNALGEKFDRTEGRPERGRGRGRGRGGRGREGGDRPARGRVFDKHSQTGIVDTDKKVDQGWGAETGTAELAAENGGEADAKAEGVTGEWTAPATTDADATGWGASAEGDASAWAAPTEGAAANGTEAPAEGRKSRRDEEEDDNTLTLEEYLAKKKESEAVPKLDAPRQINDNTEWKDAVEFHREETEEVYFAGKAKSAPKPRAKKEEKVIIEIDARFERPQRDGARGRGGRGRGDRGGDRPRGSRGRGGRGGARAENGRGGNSAAVDVDDQSAFPSLS